jgi:hypothetical protein
VQTPGAADSRVLRTSAKSASSAANLISLQCNLIRLQCNGSITFCSQKSEQNAAMQAADMKTRDSRSYKDIRRESAIFSHSTDLPYYECPYSLPCCELGAGDGQESNCAPTLKALRTVTAAAASASCGSAPGGCHRVGRRVTGLRKCDQLEVPPACWRLKILIRQRGGLSPYLWGSGCWLGRLPDTDRNGPMLHGAFLKPSKMRTTAVCIGRKDKRPQIRLLRLG